MRWDGEEGCEAEGEAPRVGILGPSHPLDGDALVGTAMTGILAWSPLTGISMAYGWNCGKLCVNMFLSLEKSRRGKISMKLN